MNILFSVILIFSALSYIKYDSGYYENLEKTGTSFVCQNNYANTFTIAFSGVFENTPQVFLQLQHFDTPNMETEFIVSISSITLNNFSIFVNCPKSGLVWSIRYSWIAIDDQRIQVINSFNMNPPDDKTFDHQLLNADVAILSIISMGYKGQIDFQISITSLTQTSVSVGITKIAGKFENLPQIGYQILLASQKDIVDFGIATFIPNYTSGAVNSQSNKFFLLPYQAIKFNYGGQQTVKLTKNIGATTSTFSVSRWGAQPQDYSQYKVQQVWLSYDFFNNKASQCYTIRVSQKLEYSPDPLPQFYVEILQTNQIYNAIGDYNIKVYKPILNLNIVVKARCITGKQIKSQFNKCNDCSIAAQKEYRFTHYCHSQINQIGYFPKFSQSQNVNQEFRVKITENSCQIYQILYNQAKIEQAIINVQFQN